MPNETLQRPSDFDYKHLLLDVGLLILYDMRKKINV